MSNELQSAYETIFISVPTLTEEELAALIERFKKVITDDGGQVESVDEWGKRRLAYEIRDLWEGYYVLINFVGPGHLPAELERLFGISDDVLRSIVIKKEE